MELSDQLKQLSNQDLMSAALALANIGTINTTSVLGGCAGHGNECGVCINNEWYGCSAQ